MKQKRPFVKLYGKPRNPVCWHCNRMLQWLTGKKRYVYARAKIQGHYRLLHIDCAMGGTYSDEGYILEPSDFETNDTT